MAPLSSSSISTTAVSTLVNYPHPAGQRRSTVFELWVNGEKVDALHADKADFAHFECAGPVNIAIVSASDATGASVRPLNRAIAANVNERSIRFLLNGPQFVCVDVPNHKPFFIYANAPELNKPKPDASGIHYYAAGRIHDAGEIILKSGETLYIEAGAVVRGFVRSTDAHNVSIRGRGILDGSYHDFAAGDRVRSIILDHCTEVHVADIVMIESTSWMLVLGSCRGVHVEGLKQIGSVVSTDGIDICGSSDVLVENCCLRNDDDNIAIKAVQVEPTRNWETDVENVLVRNCVFLNGTPGNAMEIGYELRAGRVNNIVFEDIDVLNAHGEGAVFSIHNGDRAIVENVRWENIRVEHYWDKLIDFRVVFSRYNKDEKRGVIRNIQLKNIQITHSVFNRGCSVSLISGYSADEPVQNVTLEDFFLNDKKILNADALDLHTRNVQDLRFL